MEKITKVDILNAIKEVANQDAEGMFNDKVSAADVIAYAENTIAQLEAKASKAKERAAEKRAEGDELRAKIAAVLTDEFKTIAEIVAELGDDTLTPAKVTSRLTQLCKLNEAHKTDVKVDDRKLKAYAAGPDPAEAE